MRCVNRLPTPIGGRRPSGLAYRTQGTGAPCGARARRRHRSSQTCANKKPRVKSGAAIVRLEITGRQSRVPVFPATGRVYGGLPLRANQRLSD